MGCEEWGIKCGFIAEELLPSLSLLEDSSVCDPIGVVSLTDRCQSSSPTDFCCAEVPLCSLMSFSSALYSSLHRSLLVAQPCDAAGCKISGGVQG